MTQNLGHTRYKTDRIYEYSLTANYTPFHRKTRRPLPTGRPALPFDRLHTTSGAYFAECIIRSLPSHRPISDAYFIKSIFFVSTELPAVRR